MRLRFSLFTKILLCFFLNLVILGVVFYLGFNLSFHLGPDSPVGSLNGPIESIAHRFSFEARDLDRDGRNALIERYHETYNVDFWLFSDKQELLAGTPISLPAEVLRDFRGAMNPPPPPEDDGGRRPPPPNGGPGRRPPPPGEFGPARRPPPPDRPVFTVTTSNPTRYWTGVRIPIFEKGNPESIRAVLLASSDSITGHGLFFDPKPWLFIVTAILVLSGMLWFPLVRSLTKTVGQMTTATEQIAIERFDVRVNENRTDELGRLGKAINHLAVRLAGFVTGQKRFLGDISHELNSPLARMNFALGILEERVGQENLPYVKDAQEEAKLMADLVSELLAYTRAGLKPSEVKLSSVKLRPLMDQVIAREAKGKKDINNEIDDSLQVHAQPELLTRAFSNVIRNAVRYAGQSGPIVIKSEREYHQARIIVEDNGPGVPPDELDKLFDPFYRIDSDRARVSGGAGLGLAIVKTCIEACQGTVSARPHSPSGLEVR